MRRWFARVAITMALAAFAQATAIPVTQAQPSEKKRLTSAQKKEFRTKKKDGDQAMRALRYEEAITAYEAARAIDPRPALLYNLGRAHEGLGEYATAVDYLERFVDEAPAHVRARAPKVKQLLEDLEKRVCRVTLISNVAGAEVVLRRQPMGTTPIDEPFRVNSGQAELVVTKEGYEPFRRKLDLPGGGGVTIDVNLKEIERAGVLVISSNLPGAIVHVDGKRLGNAPAEVSLEAGAHKVRVQHPDAKTVERSILVEAGQREELEIELQRIARDQPQEKGIAQKWWFWTAIGVVVVGAGVGVGVALAPSGGIESGTIPPGKARIPLVRF